MSKKLPKIKYNCPICAREFEHRSSEIRTFCSRGCKLKNQENPFKEFNCRYCDKNCKYSEVNFQRNRVYCCKKCADLHKRELQKGKNSHFWRGGKMAENELLRGSAKNEEWRKSVFSRDDYTCQECGDRSGNGHAVIIEAHHIKRWKDYPELRFELKNGVTLCRTCHMQTDSWGNHK